MLQEGFHRSFKELMSLLQRWKADRLAAGPDSKLWLKRSLEEQPHKLKTLKEHLTHAEAAERAGDDTDALQLHLTLTRRNWNANCLLSLRPHSLDQYAEVYESHLALATFFSEPDDTWLRHHFYQLSLEAARKVKTDSCRREAEADAHLAQLYSEQGNTDTHWRWTDRSLTQFHWADSFKVFVSMNWKQVDLNLQIVFVPARKSWHTHQDMLVYNVG